MEQVIFGVVTASDRASSGEYEDVSGLAIADFLYEAISTPFVIKRRIIPDDQAIIESTLAELADVGCAVIITTGGTGFTGRDSTPEALAPLFDKHIEGFGELFRQLSYDDIGTSTIQSRAVGGLANGTLIFSLPGSSGAVTLGWEKILRNQLDIDFRPCNFAELIPRFLEG